MWLPEPLYERVPQFWLLLGLLFFAFGLYLGFDYQLIFAYLGVGVLCIMRSIWIFQARSNFKKLRGAPIEQEQPSAEQEDQSSEQPTAHAAS